MWRLDRSLEGENSPKSNIEYVFPHQTDTNRKYLGEHPLNPLLSVAVRTVQKKKETPNGDKVDHYNICDSQLLQNECASSSATRDTKYALPFLQHHFSASVLYKYNRRMTECVVGTQHWQCFYTTSTKASIKQEK